LTIGCGGPLRTALSGGVWGADGGGDCCVVRACRASQAPLGLLDSEQRLLFRDAHPPRPHAPNRKSCAPERKIPQRNEAPTWHAWCFSVDTATRPGLAIRRYRPTAVTLHLSVEQPAMHHSTQTRVRSSHGQHL
jgi:hypothetical protein